MIQLRCFKSLSITNTISNHLECSSLIWWLYFFPNFYLKDLFILELGYVVISRLMRKYCLTQMKSKSFSCVGEFLFFCGTLYHKIF